MQSHAKFAADELKQADLPHTLCLPFVSDEDWCSIVLANRLDNHEMSMSGCNSALATFSHSTVCKLTASF